MRQLSIIGLFLLAAVTFSSCGDKGNSTGTFENIDFNAMVDNYKMSMSKQYSSFFQEVTDFHREVVQRNYPSSSDVVTQDRANFQNLYSFYQRVEGSMDNFLMGQLNVYPCDNSSLEQFVKEANYEFQQVDHYATKGFPALDYIWFNDSIDVITNRLNTDANYRNYAIGLMNDLLDWASDSSYMIYSSWVGDYSSDNVFSSYGPISVLVNNLVYTFELNTRARVGIPLGKFSAEIPLTDKVEAKYSGQSTSLLLANLEALKEMYLGYEVLGTGYGLEELVLEVDGGAALDKDIQTQFDVVMNMVSALTGPIDVMIENDKASIDALYAEMKKMVVFLKVDLPSRLGVLITYVDNDGD